jgi:hypothetical protein
MKRIKAHLTIFGLFLLGTVTTVQAQSTWNFNISDAGGGNSLVTWSVSGAIATPPGEALSFVQSSLPISIVASGIYGSSYVADGTPQPLPTLDGSYFQYDETTVYEPIALYSTDTAAGNGNQSFSLVVPLLPRSIGEVLLYNPGTQSAVIPVNFSNFNPGTYQSIENVFYTPLTVNLTVEPVPEPSTQALAVGAILSGLIAGRWLKTAKISRTF